MFRAEQKRAQNIRMASTISLAHSSHFESTSEHMTYFQFSFLSFSPHNLFWFRMRIAIFSILIFIAFTCLLSFSGGFAILRCNFYIWTVHCRSLCWKSIGCLVFFELHKCKSNVWMQLKEWHMPLSPFEYQSKNSMLTSRERNATMVQTRFRRRYAFSQTTENNRSEWAFGAINWNDIPSRESFQFWMRSRFSICHSTDTKIVTLKRIRA